MTESPATVLSFLIASIVPSVAAALSSPGLGGGPGADVGTLAGFLVLFYFYSVYAVGLLGLPKAVVWVPSEVRTCLTSAIWRGSMAAHSAH